MALLAAKDSFQVENLSDIILNLAWVLVIRRYVHKFQPRGKITHRSYDRLYKEVLKRKEIGKSRLQELDNFCIRYSWNGEGEWCNRDRTTTGLSVLKSMRMNCEPCDPTTVEQARVMDCVSTKHDFKEFVACASVLSTFATREFATELYGEMPEDSVKQFAMLEKAVLKVAKRGRAEYINELFNSAQRHEAACKSNSWRKQHFSKLAADALDVDAFTKYTSRRELLVGLTKQKGNLSGKNMYQVMKRALKKKDRLPRAFSRTSNDELETSLIMTAQGSRKFINLFHGHEKMFAHNVVHESALVQFSEWALPVYRKFTVLTPARNVEAGGC
eukprot:TRINITY_DN18469_c0_g1_i2.p1 TRINITY_DN18469_c0_g1~~TRINITY_DN18469_c0_g1_i2.p1  ORF type:complete len:330 (+),score=50.84 TRINITY_DN18469_c0_g1_i2:83-1072(+)